MVTNALSVAGVQLEWAGACMCTKFTSELKMLDVFMEVLWKLGKMCGFFLVCSTLSIYYVTVDLLQQQ